MARVVKVFRTLRNHWKKTTFAVCVISYGGNWLYGRHWWVMLISFSSVFVFQIICCLFHLCKGCIFKRQCCQNVCFYEHAYQLV